MTSPGQMALPPAPRQRLMPVLLDEIVATDPDRVLYSIARTDNPADGFQDISAAVFARAVDRCAWFIHETLGRPEDKAFPTLTYMGPQGLEYAIVTLACVKVGYKLLLSSLRNTLEAHLALLDGTECLAMLLPPGFRVPIAEQILAARPQLRLVRSPGLQHWIGDDGTRPSGRPYPYTKTVAEAMYDPILVLHTSGSTGIPKPVVLNNASYTAMDALSALPDPVYPTICSGTRMYSAFPLFHAGGIYLVLPGVLYSSYTAVLGPSPPSADVANGVHVHGNVQHSCLPPAVIVDLTRHPEHLENLGRLTMIAFGGGPLPQAVGDLASTKTKMLNILGSTECSVLAVTPNPDPSDWMYMNVSAITGREYRHVSGDLYEQVIVRRPELEPYQGVFRAFPELDEWPMRDLYSRHPTKQDLWLHRGRADDIIVYYTGEKLNPLEMEAIINSNPVVSAALVTGVKRFQSSLLVEATTTPTTETERRALLDAIWPSVQAANKASPSHARIHRNMILLTSPDKPMLRAGKGTVQRRMTTDLYEAELDDLYKASESAKGQTNGVLGPQTTVDGAVRHIIAAYTDLDLDRLAPDDNLFELGLDSLQVVAIAREANDFLASHGRPPSLEPRSVYSNPSVRALVTLVSALTEGTAPASQAAETSEQKMKKFYELHTSELPLTARPAQPKPADSFVVLLTGSTGSLGSYILDSLVSDPRVSKVYCLNRGPASRQRQHGSQLAKALQPPPDNKVEFFDADLSKPYFGLSAQQYKRLLDEVTTAILNAWQVDFNLQVDSFATHIAAVRRFIDFSARSRFGARVFFISSIGAVLGWRAVASSTAAAAAVPECIFEDWRIAVGSGYAQSKFVAERLLDAAAREAGIPAVVCRVGQIAGPTSAAGIWPKQEWLPSIVASSKYLGKLPATLGKVDTVDWIPVDLLGRSIVELATAAPEDATPGGASVYHAVNPQSTTWSQLVHVVAESLKESGVEVVPLGEWLDALRQSGGASADFARNPALKLIDFCEDMLGDEPPVLLETGAAAAASETLVSVGPVQEAWMENWMQQWNF